jgi:hypothetical protein
VERKSCKCHGSRNAERLPPLTALFFYFLFSGQPRHYQCLVLRGVAGKIKEIERKDKELWIDSHPQPKAGHFMTRMCDHTQFFERTGQYKLSLIHSLRCGHSSSFVLSLICEDAHIQRMERKFMRLRAGQSFVSSLNAGAVTILFELALSNFLFFYKYL